MDFELNDEQRSIADLAAKILGDLCAPDALRTHERSGEPVLTKAWSALAEADLLGVALPERTGGGGYGVVEACLVAEQVGRNVAPIPYLPTLACALTLAELGVHDDLVGGVAAGTAILAAAVSDRAAPVSVAEDGRLTGDVPSVLWAEQAHHLLVPASTASGDVALYLVDPSSAGVALRTESAMWGLPQAAVELAGVAGERVGDAEGVAQLVRYATALSCSAVVGVCEGALRITASYVSEREQFGAKIGTFQAVAQRIADAYIDTQGVRLTALQAAWRLSEGIPCDEELHIAKFWAADGGHRVAHAAQHLHGGIGLDVDYPVHRYFRWAKVLELHHGTGTDHLRKLGTLLAADPVANVG